LKPAGTSRGVLQEKDSWFIILSDQSQPERVGIGECSVIPGLSMDNPEDMVSMLNGTCMALNHGYALPDLTVFPAIRFALETALNDFESGGKQVLFNTKFTEGTAGIPINGLIWMGSKGSMLEQVAEKLDKGFKVLKLKVGAIDFEDEIDLIRAIRIEHPASELEIRLDANGAWSEGEAISKLDRLSAYNIHSLEQPIAAGQTEEMAEICNLSNIPIALDEELISVVDSGERVKLLQTINPRYIILKPSLLGGLEQSKEWISIAQSTDIQWWVTSALESNVGLNAIAQWTATLDTKLPQGLGTGSLFENNIPSPLEVRGDKLYYRNGGSWDLSYLSG